MHYSWVVLRREDDYMPLLLLSAGVCGADVTRLSSPVLMMGRLVIYKWSETIRGMAWATRLVTSRPTNLSDYINVNERNNSFAI